MPTLHLVPHTHWDREWYLPFREFQVKLVHLIDLLLELLDRDSRYAHFTLDGQTIVLEDYLEIRPEREADLLRHVRSGRLAIGPWYILPDEFLVSPEALIRNLLRGSRDCARFGGRMEVGYIPDPFGHIGQMPQILRGFGIGAAAFARGLGEEPCELWWESPDDSRVLLGYLRDSYDNAARAPGATDAFSEFIARKRESLQPHSAVGHLLLLNGTDHHEPQPALGSLVEAASLPGDDLRISTLQGYFDGITAEIHERRLPLPVHRGEARGSSRRHLLPGVLSSRGWIKQRNHTCELLLEAWAEPWSAWAELLTGAAPDRAVWTGHLLTPRVRRPKGLLDQAWRLLLRCQPHDSICGCSIDQVHEEMRPRFDEVEQLGEEVVRQSLAAVASRVDTARLADHSARAAWVIFNPNGQSRTDVVRVKLELPAGADPFEIVDGDGQPVPYQTLARAARSLTDMELDPDGLRGMAALVEGGTVMGLAIQSAAVVRREALHLVDVVLSETADPNPEALRAIGPEFERLLAEGSARRFRLLAHFSTEVEVEFLAKDVSAHGYRSYGLRAAPGPGDAGDRARHPGPRAIENEHLRAEAAEDGTLTLTDRRTGRIFPGLLVFRDEGDRGDSYTFCPVGGEEARVGFSAKPEAATLSTAWGEVLEIRGSLRLPRGLSPDRTRRSEELVDIPIAITARLPQAARRLDLEIALENRAEDHRLQLLFPAGVETQLAEYDGHFEIVQRPTQISTGETDWMEHPVPEAPMRAFVGVPGALLVAARGLREASVSPDGVIAVTLLRSFGWLSRDDLSTRRGGAGPGLPTPGGQNLGTHNFHVSLVPWGEDDAATYIEAYAFQAPLRGSGTAIHSGPLPASGSLLRIEPAGLQMSALKEAEDRRGLVLRVVNLTDRQLDANVRCMLPLARAALARMDEAPLEELRLTDPKTIRVQFDPHQVQTIRLEFPPLDRSEDSSAAQSAASE